MNVVLIIPTGIGCAIGGHAGDGNPVAKLIGSVCDNLITHPNVVNASDINEMPENTLYVEGSTLDRFLNGELCLQKVHYNKILVVTNPPLRNEVLNSVSAARVTIGADISIEVLKRPLRMEGYIKDNRATGNIYGAEELIDQIKGRDFDALAITTEIEVDKGVHADYFKNGGINPWGGVEAELSKIVSRALNKPVAHSPVENPEAKNFNEVVDPRMAAEIVSVSYLHCILKGLHKAPRLLIGPPLVYRDELSLNEVDFLISPYNCFGPAHSACLQADIPIIVVKENRTYTIAVQRFKYIFVDNYIEAAGLIQAYKAGIDWRSVRRPIDHTEVVDGENDNKRGD